MRAFSIFIAGSLAANEESHHRQTSPEPEPRPALTSACVFRDWNSCPSLCCVTLRYSRAINFVAARVRRRKICTFVPRRRWNVTGRKCCVALLCVCIWSSVVVMQHCCLTTNHLPDDPKPAPEKPFSCSRRMTHMGAVRVVTFVYLYLIYTQLSTVFGRMRKNVWVNRFQSYIRWAPNWKWPPPAKTAVQFRLIDSAVLRFCP